MNLTTSAFHILVLHYNLLLGLVLSYLCYVVLTSAVACIINCNYTGT